MQTISSQAKGLGYMTVEWFNIFPLKVHVSSIAMSIPKGLNFPHTSVLFYYKSVIKKHSHTMYMQLNITFLPKCSACMDGYL